MLPVEAEIRIARIDGPKSISVGQPLGLKCVVQTRADKVITLSWSKDGREFYRYQPHDKRNASLAFKMDGVFVDVSTSSVVLSHNELESCSNLVKFLIEHRKNSLERTLSGLLIQHWRPVADIAAKRQVPHFKRPAWKLISALKMVSILWISSEEQASVEPECD